MNYDAVCIKRATGAEVARNLPRRKVRRTMWPVRAKGEHGCWRVSREAACSHHLQSLDPCQVDQRRRVKDEGLSDIAVVYHSLMICRQAARRNGCYQPA